MAKRGTKMKQTKQGVIFQRQSRDGLCRIAALNNALQRLVVNEQNFGKFCDEYDKLNGLSQGFSREFHYFVADGSNLLCFILSKFEKNLEFEVVLSTALQGQSLHTSETSQPRQSSEQGSACGSSGSEDSEGSEDEASGAWGKAARSNGCFSHEQLEHSIAILLFSLDHVWVLRRHPTHDHWLALDGLHRRPTRAWPNMDGAAGAIIVRQVRGQLPATAAPVCDVLAMAALSVGIDAPGSASPATVQAGPGPGEAGWPSRQNLTPSHAKAGRHKEPVVPRRRRQADP